MPKTIIVTSGPTDEKIDDVMKITNMSTGTLGAMIATVLAKRDPEAVIYYVSTKMCKKPSAVNDEVNPVRWVRIDSTDDMLRAITRLLKENRVDAVVHTAAVGDYKTDYAIRGEDLAQEIADAVAANPSITASEILEIIQNPSALQDPDSKISSYEPNLMVKLGLTPKIIGAIKPLSPDTVLIGCKLLDHVPKRHLFDVASRLRRKNGADYVIANDLSLIGNGRHPAMIVAPSGLDGEDGVALECRTKAEIAQAVSDLLYGDGKYANLAVMPAPGEDEAWNLD